MSKNLKLIRDTYINGKPIFAADYKDKPLETDDGTARDLILYGHAEIWPAAMAGDDAEVEDENYQKMNKADLVTLAEGKGLTVPEGATKADIIALLEK